MPSVHPSPCPAGDNAAFVRFVSIPPGPAVKVWVLNNHVIGYHTHWVAGRTIPCCGPVQGCPCGSVRLVTRWLGVLGVQPISARVPFLLGLTRGAFANCPNLVALQHSLRGAMLEVRRLGPNRTSPLAVTMASMPPCEGQALRPGFPQPVNVPYHLSRIWGFQVLDETRLPSEGDKGP